MYDDLYAALNTPGATMADLGEQAGAYAPRANSLGGSGAEEEAAQGLALLSQNRGNPTLVPGTTPAQNPTRRLQFQTPTTQGQPIPITAGAPVVGAVMAALKEKNTRPVRGGTEAGIQASSIVWSCKEGGIPGTSIGFLRGD
eukprot:scaffold51458_cov24-Cyclotella_meneghiniana.AAC.2